MMDKSKYNLFEFRNSKLIFITWTIFGLFAAVNPAFSQNKTQIDTAAQNADSIIQYITPLEYAFMMHEETSWMLKVNFIVIDPEENGGFKIGFEKRIAPSFTLNGELQFVFNERDVTDAFVGTLETRWYYNMKRLVQEKRSKRNLSGNYFSLGASYWLLINEPYESTYYKYSNNFVSLFGKYGIQRRFLKRGYVDLGIKTGFDFFLNTEYRPTFFIITYLDAGYAYAKDKRNLDREKLCPILRCYATDKFILKANFINIFSFFVYNELEGNESILFQLNPTIGAEFKFGKSPFSLNTELFVRTRFDFDISKKNNTDYTWYMIEPGLLLEGRWYYNLNKRIMKGKTGNGLSANYIGLGSRFTYTTVTIEDFKPTPPGIHLVPPTTTRPFNRTKTEMFYYVNTGIQRLLSDHMYYDVNFKFGYMIENSKKTDRDAYKQESPQVEIGMAVGYRF